MTDHPGLAAIIVVAVGYIAFLALERWLNRRRYAGRRAYERGEDVNASWPPAKRDGWAEAWHEDHRARMGYRGPR